MSPPVLRRLRGGVALFLAAPLLAQAPPGATPAPTPGKGVTAAEEVTVVMLDVVAVDGKNRPVFGLTPEDFEIRVAGKVQTIDSFEPPKESAAGAAKEGRPDSEERITGMTTPFDPSATVRHVLFWVDLEQLPRRSIMDTASALHAALDHAPSGRYGLVTHFGGPLGHAWDSDSVDALLDEADRMSLEVGEGAPESAMRTKTGTYGTPRGADSPPQYEARKAFETSLIGDWVSTLQAGGDTRVITQAITDYLAAERRRVRAAVEDLRDAAGRLAALEGPRHLVLMSEGFERVPGFDFLARLRAEQNARVRTPAAASPSGSSGRGRILDAPSWPGAPGASASVGGSSFAFDSSPLYEVDDLSRWFQASGVMVHFLDPGGLGRDQPSASDRYAFESKLRADDLRNLQETPLRYAADTGGLSRASANDAGAVLAEFLDATSATYRIGVRLLGVDPKKTYSVKVATRKAGVKMLARSAFRLSGPAPQVAAALGADARRAEAAARADERRPGVARAAKKPIPVTLEWKGRATTASSDPAKPYWKLEVRIPHEELRFDTDSDAFVASVKIAVEAAAVNGAARDSVVDDWFLSYSGEEYKEVRDTAASRLVTLQLPPGRYDLKVSVTDALGGTFGQATLRVDAR
jgi:VWFA-related protein